jgi:hypothetical protein
MEVGSLYGSCLGKPRSASEGRLQLDRGFLKNEAIHCYKHKSHCQLEPMKITLPSYCEPTRCLCILNYSNYLRMRICYISSPTRRASPPCCVYMENYPARLPEVSGHTKRDLG